MVLVGDSQKDVTCRECHKSGHKSRAMDEEPVLSESVWVGGPLCGDTGRLNLIVSKNCLVSDI